MGGGIPTAPKFCTSRGLVNCVNLMSFIAEWTEDCTGPEGSRLCVDIIANFLITCYIVTTVEILSSNLIENDLSGSNSTMEAYVTITVHPDGKYGSH